MKKTVEQVLDEIGAGDVPQLLVYNKIDLPGYQSRVDLDEHNQPSRVWLSSINKTGFEDLLSVLGRRFTEDKVRCNLLLQADEGQIRAYLYTEGAIDSEEFGKNGEMALNLKLSPALLKKLHRKYQFNENRIVLSTDNLAGAA